MPKLIPMHSVIVSRPNKDKRKDANGNVIHERIAVPMNKPFEFTAAEFEDLKASGHTFRTPSSDTGETDDAGALDADAADEAARIAAEEAAANGGAPLDAAVTARNARDPKPGVKKTGTAPNAGNESEEGDEL